MLLTFLDNNVLDIYKGRTKRYKGLIRIGCKFVCFSKNV